VPIDARFDLAPEEAVAFLEGKGLRASFAWQDVWADEHEAGFTVAKMADLDLLADVKRAVARALQDGETLQQFKNALVPRMQAAGWWGVDEQVDPLTGKPRLVQLGSARRLQTIFRTNLSMAYSAGDWSKIEETADDAPYLMYDAVDDNLTRDQHRAWDGIVLRWDNPWWKTHRGPNGYNCRCTTIQLSIRDLRRMGKSGADETPPIKRREWVNKRTGEVMQIPVGIDPGFDYNPGEGRVAELRYALESKRRAFEAGR
jgi:SPP1 gp7 family putative phage head morphogenesis protein